VSISCRQYLAFTCALLLQLSLFASLVHATEHQFHVQGELCASFINFGQQDLSVDVTSTTIGFDLSSVELCVESKPFIQSYSRPVYSSRAPPAS